MVNTKLINDLITEKGLKLKFIAEKMGITSTGLRQKINNKTEFKVSEAYILCKVLGVDGIQLKNDIFLTPSDTLSKHKA